MSDETGDAPGRGFPSGELAFDGYGRLGLKMLRLTPQLRATGAEVHWAIDDARELEKLVPGLKLVEEKIKHESAEIARMSWPARLTVSLWRYVPALRKIGRLLRYQFQPDFAVASAREKAAAKLSRSSGLRNPPMLTEFPCASTSIRVIPISS